MTYTEYLTSTYSILVRLLLHIPNLATNLALLADSNTIYWLLGSG